MFIEQAPSYSAAAKGLAAAFTIDFNADLQHYMHLTSSWQGDPVLARSMYVNNYDNSFELSIVNGGFTTVVPSLSVGYVDINGLDAIVITSPQKGIVKLSVLNFSVPPGFTERGNAPESVVKIPYTVAGNVNITSANVASDMCYSSSNGMLYVVCRNTSLLITINPQTNKVIETKSLPNIPTCICDGAGDFLYIGLDCSALGNNYVGVYNQVSKVFTAYIQPGASKNATDICYTALYSHIYVAASGSGPMVLNSSNYNAVTIALGAFSVNNLCVDPNGAVFGFDSTSSTNHANRYINGAVNVAGATLANAIMPYCAVKVGSGAAGNIYVGGNNQIARVDYAFAQLQQFAMAGNNLQTICYNPDINNVHVSMSAGPIVSISTLLNGVVNTMANAGAALTMVYAPNALRYYFATAGGEIRYVDN